MPIIVNVLATKRVLGNDLSDLPIAIEDDEKIQVVHPHDFAGKFLPPHEFR